MNNKIRNVGSSKNEIILIRGLPGSGKSTQAKAMTGYIHLEADMYLIVNGKYEYDVSKVKAAHDWCVAEAKEALERGVNVVVSNTFSQQWEMQRYIDLGYSYKVIEMNGKFMNIHGVPEDKIKSMSEKWEKIPENWNV